MPSIHPRVDFIRSSKVSMRVCGPKLSICGLCLSIWGMLQLVFMSLALHSRSVAFVEDIPDPGPDVETQEQYLAHMERNYDLLAHNCGVAASLYLVTFLVSLHQYWMNSKASPTGYQRYH
ncbi:hypothetical protein TCAL_04606 [Tigriopus californicus]|uniref:Uncharacterized protein n=2 Tax=Tigriopus californicus TaxID=6832 RepID=A0A553P9L5_TIGCA|nr:ribonuclease kappa-like isoform X2 [Tigriopus californicus]TRY74385.1 hypothetical protein TCAL_04606 [Tigriopus californicus]